MTYHFRTCFRSMRRRTLAICIARRTVPTAEARQLSNPYNNGPEAMSGPILTSDETLTSFCNFSFLRFGHRSVRAEFGGGPARPGISGPHSHRIHVVDED